LFFRGIEWAGLKSFVSYAFPTTTSALVRNELCLTDVLTGETENLRTDKGEEPPIDIVKVSPQKQYFILVLSGGPVELWDLRSKHILRALPKKFPIITALVSDNRVYSVRGLEWSELGGSHGCPGRLWDRFL